MGKQTIADYLARTLAAADVERIWGVTGDSLNGLSDSLQRLGSIRWMHTRHEEVAAFAAGADIKEMAELSFSEVFGSDFFAAWGKLAAVRTPLIAAVAGYALGGGCELAMLCDFIVASEKAKFGQPEINLGVAPGIGGSQRLTRLVGKAKAMDMVLTARMMDAAEAERGGLVSRVVPLDKLMDEALGAALMICGYGQLSVMAAKESVNRAFESGLSDGVMFERRMFHSLFATADQKEGMDAFLNKRAPNFVNG